MPCFKASLDRTERNEKNKPSALAKAMFYIVMAFTKHTLCTILSICVVLVALAIGLAIGLMHRGGSSSSTPTNTMNNSSTPAPVVPRTPFQTGIHLTPTSCPANTTEFHYLLYDYSQSPDGTPPLLKPPSETSSLNFTIFGDPSFTKMFQISAFLSEVKYDSALISFSSQEFEDANGGVFGITITVANGGSFSIYSNGYFEFVREGCSGSIADFVDLPTIDVNFTGGGNDSTILRRRFNTPAKRQNNQNTFDVSLTLKDVSDHPVKALNPRLNCVIGLVGYLWNSFSDLGTSYLDTDFKDNGNGTYLGKCSELEPTSIGKLCEAKFHRVCRRYTKKPIVEVCAAIRQLILDRSIKLGEGNPYGDLISAGGATVVETLCRATKIVQGDVCNYLIVDNIPKFCQNLAEHGAVRVWADNLPGCFEKPDTEINVLVITSTDVVRATATVFTCSRG